MSATDDVRDDTSPVARSVPIDEPASAADTIRGAFLKRAIEAERQTAGGGLADDAAAAGGIPLRGAFLSRLSSGGPGAIRGGGTNEGATLRSVYAARFAAGLEPTRATAPGRAAKKAVAKKAKPKTKVKAKAKKAKPAKAAKRARTAAARKPRKAAAPKRKAAAPRAKRAAKGKGRRR